MKIIVTSTVGAKTLYEAAYFVEEDGRIAVYDENDVLVGIHAIGSWASARLAPEDEN